MVSSDLQPIRLNCLVSGDDPRFHIFPIKIARTESVSDLKKLIKEEKRPEFNTVAADHLKLWNASDLIPRSDANNTCILLSKLLISSLCHPLVSCVGQHCHSVLYIELAFSALSAIPMFSLNCLVLGDDPIYTFPIKITRTESVGDLKKLIKEEKRPEFNAVAADRLQLWNVSNLMPMI
ncbi:hypothetical protein DFJ58DRAFT_659315 [Suillus subalutaceus]|uniref:uncharacterized protein n=1 Tax=Suillus subalutaceus TaxID=48586 RepID=UPI001B85B77C|nr:uncharacterized protein DFJ58DRAFT_659315 [Suillus subalutaceus]KAG1856707.1 hypothetical protein DFJ58DRAFT_659315 [Suillus subalutaceus]